MMYKIVPTSERALQSARRGRHDLYPWKLLEVGQSFIVPRNNVRDDSLRSIANVAGKRLNRKFKVAKFEDHYEVARIA